MLGEELETRYVIMEKIKKNLLSEKQEIEIQMSLIAKIKEESI